MVVVNAGNTPNWCLFTVSLGLQQYLFQKELEAKNPGATIIPVIISSDKTQLTLFHNQQAYPVYLTIGNLPKELHQKPSLHGQVLLVYLLTAKLNYIMNKSA